MPRDSGSSGPTTVNRFSRSANSASFSIARADRYASANSPCRASRCAVDFLNLGALADLPDQRVLAPLPMTRTFVRTESLKLRSMMEDEGTIIDFRPHHSLTSKVLFPDFRAHRNKSTAMVLPLRRPDHRLMDK
jgi:hypothetical protein